MNELLKTIAGDPMRLFGAFKELERVLGASQSDDREPNSGFKRFSQPRKTQRPQRSSRPSLPTEFDDEDDDVDSNDAELPDSYPGEEERIPLPTVEEFELVLKRARTDRGRIAGRWGVDLFLSTLRLETHSTVGGSPRVLWSGEKVSLSSRSLRARIRRALDVAPSDWTAVCFDSGAGDDAFCDAERVERALAILRSERPNSLVFVDGRCPGLELSHRVLLRFEERVDAGWETVAREAAELARVAVVRLNKLSSFDRRRWESVSDACDGAFAGPVGEGHVVDLFLSTPEARSEGKWCWSRESWRASFSALADPPSYGTGTFRSHSSKGSTFRLWRLTASRPELERAQRMAAEGPSRSREPESFAPDSLAWWETPTD